MNELQKYKISNLINLLDKYKDKYGDIDVNSLITKLNENLPNRCKHLGCPKNVCLQTIPIKSQKKCHHHSCSMDFCNIKTIKKQRERDKNDCSCCGVDLRKNKCLWDTNLDNSATCIQSVYRGYICRKKLKNKY